MRKCTRFTTKAVLFFLSAAPFVSFAQTTHVVQVMDNFFQPKDITIHAGDTVRWENPPGGNPHNAIAEDFSFSSGPTSSSWTFERTFSEGSEYPYYCQPHRIDGMVGSITVEGSIDPPFDINAVLNGNWWNGPPRAGEGAQIEVADAGGGELVFVATMYSYGPGGGQIFLVAVGTPAGDTVEVDVFITDGGVWGEGFDPDDIVETQWGTGTFTAESCDLMHMSLMPNLDYQTRGYTDLAYDLMRLTTPDVACPYEG